MSVNPTPPEDGLPSPRRYIATAAVLAGIVLVVLDGAIANVALPTMARALEVSPAASIWVITAYQMAIVMALLPCGAIGEIRGYRQVFVTGVVIFTVASAACALSPSLPWLVGARFVQGLGGAAVMAPIAALLRHTHPHRLLGTAIGWNALAVALSSAAGPMLGAGILSVASWPWLFAVNIPVGALVLFAARSLPHSVGNKHKLDVLSVGLNVGVFAPLVVGVDMLTTRPALGIAMLCLSAISLVALIRRESPRAKPLIPLDLLRLFPFRISVIASVCCFTGQMASFVALPFYLQHTLGQSPLMTGLYMTPWPLAVALAAPVSGRMAKRVPTAWLCAAGGACLALGLALAAAWPLHRNLAPLVGLMIVSGVGFGFFQTPNNLNMLLSAPKERSGAAGAMLGTARLIGQTAGAVLMALLFTLMAPDIAPRIGLAIGAAAALAGGLVSTLRRGI